MTRPDLSSNDPRKAEAAPRVARALGICALVFAFGALIALFVGADLAALFQAIGAVILTLFSVVAWRIAIREQH